MPQVAAFTPSGREVEPLRKANAARRTRAFFRGASVALGLALPFATAVLMLLGLIGLGVGKLLLIAIFLLGPLALGLVAMLASARGKTKEIAPAIDAAWMSVANDLAQAKGGALSAADLVAKLGIGEAQADELAALVDVDAAVSQAAPPLRIAAGTTEAGDAKALAAQAEDEAAAEASRALEASPPKRAP